MPPPDSEHAATVKKYVVYDLTVRQDLTSSDPHPATIERRYTNFLELHRGLRKDYAPLMDSSTTPPFPKKVLMGNFSRDLIAERSAAFEAFLDHIVGQSALRESAHFLHFLQGIELTRACQLLDERRNEQAVPILENCFRLLNKVSFVNCLHLGEIKIQTQIVKYCYFLPGLYGQIEIGAITFVSFGGRVHNISRSTSIR